MCLRSISSVYFELFGSWDDEIIWRDVLYMYLIIANIVKLCVTLRLLDVFYVAKTIKYYSYEFS